MLDIIQNHYQLLLVGTFPNGPLGGLALTLILSVLGLIAAFPLSILLALGRLSPIGPIRYVATTIVYVVRGTPLLMLIFWSYFLLPLLIGNTVSAFATLLCSLVIYEAAYLSEVVRAGIVALPPGQVEAARALGFGRAKTMVYIVLPQAIYNMLPSLVSQFASLIKETSLGYVISVHELTSAANRLNSELLTKPFEVFSILALTYFLVCTFVTFVAHVIERRVARRREGQSNPSIRVHRDQIYESQ
ncbi:amino acid ABC transporter permease [Candidimonas sp. SYP-B2681]|uniref:amino acid ABC transporter permease n=1 Tax=Candidimonas sp. SYP-B2681 TaxID=2497686 RepID=UPI000F893470|nr:amino acid ABC transporter permease [Candidimonas sp. SYP-B2681]RTZ41497.1 amino acid ABC transporter permease [Candidimonas sp. SYP-B2681]